MGFGGGSILSVSGIQAIAFLPFALGRRHKEMVPKSIYSEVKELWRRTNRYVDRVDSVIKGLKWRERQFGHLRKVEKCFVLVPLSVSHQGGL